MKNRIDTLKLRAFEYALIKLIIWFCENKDLVPIDKKTNTKYNENFAFDVHKALILPFFVCVGNGSLKYLFNLWSNFYAFTSGPFSNLIVEEVLFDNCANLRFISLNKENSTIIIDESLPLDNILSMLKSEIVSLELKLLEILENDYGKSKSTIQAIDNSIIRLRDNDAEMIDLSHKSLYRVSRSFRAYNRLIDSDPNIPISLEEVSEDASVLEPA